MDNIQAARAASLPPLAIGSFTAAPGDPTLMDRRLVIRAGAQSAPGGSYARFLGDTLAAELKGAGRLDPQSDRVISGVVTHAELDSFVPKGHAALAVTFVLTRSGKAVFEKTLSEDAVWESEVVGAVAIPDAFNHYMSLFHRLVGDLMSDSDFRAAAHAP